MSKIYVVEDDENIREVVIYALQSAGFQAFGFETGSDFWDGMKKSPDHPALVLLDIMLPGEGGLSILQKLRSDPRWRTLPTIMLTAKGNESDKVRGLNLGADDYVSKPFGVMELIARIHAVLRRSRALSKPGQKLEYKDILLDNARRAVFVGGGQTALTFKEYELLHYLLINAGIVLTRDQIMEAVWGYDFEGESRTIDMHIRTLRRKLGAAGEHIKTIRNVGYRLGD